ncbi:twin-arginine translocase TatA/TatE family subunit [Paenibacillus sp. YIM B09110]
MNIGVTGIVLLVILGLLLFGPSKLPQLGRAIGTTLIVRASST